MRTHLKSPIQTNEMYQSLDSLDMKKDAQDDYSDELLLIIIVDIKEWKKGAWWISTIQEILPEIYKKHLSES